MYRNYGRRGAHRTETIFYFLCMYISLTLSWFLFQNTLECTILYCIMCLSTISLISQPNLIYKFVNQKNKKQANKEHFYVVNLIFSLYSRLYSIYNWTLVWFYVLLLLLRAYGIEWLVLTAVSVYMARVWAILYLSLILFSFNSI